jgi:hypothetical protein
MPTPTITKSHLAQQIGLGQGRALIGRGGFGADHRDAAVKAQRAQFGRQCCSGLARTDDDDLPHEATSPSGPSVERSL